MARGTLTSWEDAQRQIGDILASLNANPSLALAAAANPLFALQELGYEVNADVRQEFEDRIRFGKSAAAQLQSLRESVFKLAGKPFDLDAPEALFSTLSHLLPKAPERPENKLSPSDVEPLIPEIMSRSKPQDPLERFRGAHPVLEPLLQYRALEASTPRLATRTLYDEIRQGKRRLPISKIVARLRRP